jgi:hypothetical protein
MPLRAATRHPYANGRHDITRYPSAAMPSHTDTLSDGIPYRRAGRRSVRHGARLASIYGKRGYNLAQCALGDKACSEHPVAQWRNRTPKHAATHKA